MVTRIFPQKIREEGNLTACQSEFIRLDFCQGPSNLKDAPQHLEPCGEKNVKWYC